MWIHNKKSIKEEPISGKVQKFQNSNGLFDHIPYP